MICYQNLDGVFVCVWKARIYIYQYPIHVFKIGTFCEFHDDMGVF